MATAFVAMLGSSPLACPCSYDPTFKVEVCSHEPLWHGTHSPEDVAVEVMTLCAELEPLIAAQIIKRATGSPTSRGIIRRRAYSNTFETHANLLVDKMTKCLDNLQDTAPNLLDYISQTGLETLYPKVAGYVRTSYLPFNQTSTKSPMNGYFTHLSTLNQISIMCQQLRHDATNLSNHKYIAHQIALLYQSLNQLGSGAVIQDYKTNIETTFKKVKHALAPREGGEIPQLPAEFTKWLVDMTSDLLQLVTSFSMDINHPLLPAIAFLQQS